METTSHLERMGEELKCPICLSLLKSAVSLTCNHIFCNHCIDKSMRSDSTCPVCKIPYQRREIRPAPHMDTLVSIYKSMEVSSGVNILVTQTEPQTTAHDNQVEDATAYNSNTTSKAFQNTPNTQNQRKNKGKAPKGSSKRLKKCTDPVRPSFPIKKRVQVPQHHPQETPTRLTNLEGEKSERTQTNVAGLEDTAHLHKNEERLFSPFFWLRDEEDAEETIEPTPLDTLNISQPNVPCFSDIKDSLDDNSCHVTSKEDGIFDSEMFDWTQRPCSPELCASPMKMQDKESDGYDIVQERVDRGTSQHDVMQGQETDNMEVVFPNLSVDHEVKVKGSKKRGKKTKESIQKKRVKRDTDKKDTTIQQLTKRTRMSKNQDPNNTNNTTTEINKTSLPQFPCEPSLVDGEIKTCASRKQTEKGKVSKKLKASKKVPFSTKKGMNAKSVDDIPKSSEKGKVSKKLKASKKVTFSRKKGMNAKSLDDIPKVSEKGKVSKKQKTSKKVTFSTTESLKAKSVDDILKTSENVAAKEKGEDSTLSDISCAFCHSKEESNISGCMTHYLKGKPITLDHDGISSAIHAHSNCTEWAPNVYFEDDIAINLEAELTRSKRIKCSCCGIKGASLGCYEKSCHKSFHFPCAKSTPKCRWDEDNFVMLCPLHASHKLPNETSGSQLKEKKKCIPKRHWTTSRWDTHGLFTKNVLCCSALTSVEKETIATFERLSGVTILKTYDSRVTHVIASVDENEACRRTLKYLMGIIEGKWILTFEWIKACLEVKKPVDEQLYEINLDVYGFKGGPKLGRSRLLNKAPKLFNGVKFYFTGDFEASYKGYLHDLIIAAGGIVLHRKPIAVNYEQQFLIYSVEITDKVKANERNRILSQRKSDAEALARSSGGVAVSNFWILNSIAASKLQDLE